MNPQYRREERPKHKPTQEDEYQRQMTEAAYAAAVKVLKRILAEDTNRLVRTLGKQEMGDLVTSTISGYCLKRAEIEAWEREHADEICERAHLEIDIFA